ncbi:CidA/LrgA family protein [Bacillus benzoevorans]|uniref:Holin-like protein n=1 Tax=Bacillus benzoevorans TaxID=1456 RepID=A0A7X0HQZ3_9BACI|nr:CidA/LrgA family protein [Bacillus benzoevorans]MBB6445194.1 holin-like protein [Bacillus benzoevorans]
MAARIKSRIRIKGAFMVGKFILIMLQLFVLMIVNQVGMFLVHWIGVPIPGNVLGMVILFLLLWSGIIPLKWVEGASTVLVKHLAFFFIPISVGIMTLGALFMESGLRIMFILLVSTFIGLFFSGNLSQMLIHKKEEVKAESHHHSL